jgi:hydroxypyruvate isomerase
MTARTARTPGEPIWPLVANISLLFSEFPLLERIPAARTAGFDAVEAWWPFPGPGFDQQVEQFLHTIEDHRMQLAGLNFFAGDMPGGERGIVSRPDRRDEFTENVDAIVRIARRTEASGFNALYGQRQPDMDPAGQDRVGRENLVYATRALAEVGGTVLLEPLSRGLNGAYPLETATQAVKIIQRVREITGSDNIGLLFDTFHLANNGEDLVAVINRFGSLIAHVQLADAPGRGAPGTGTVDFDSVLAALARVGYDRSIACEYVPDGDTAASLTWIARTPYVRLGQPEPD